MTMSICNQWPGLKHHHFLTCCVDKSSKEIKSDCLDIAAHCPVVKSEDVVLSGRVGPQTRSKFDSVAKLIIRKLHYIH